MLINRFVKKQRKFAKSNGNYFTFSSKTNNFIAKIRWIFRKK